MSTSLPRGTLILSVDLEFSGPRAGLAEQRALDNALERLLACLARHDMPATWAVADPAVSAARGRIEAAGRGHELAIAGDASWVGQAAGRSRFARELARRAAQARGAGLSVRTLVLKTELPGEHADLAIKEGIVAVRQTGPASVARKAGSLPRTLRFGLWEVPANVTLPGASRWLPGGGGTRAACYEIDQAIERRGPVHLALDGRCWRPRSAGGKRRRADRRTRGPTPAARIARCRHDGPHRRLAGARQSGTAPAFDPALGRVVPGTVPTLRSKMGLSTVPLRERSQFYAAKWDCPGAAIDVHLPPAPHVDDTIESRPKQSPIASGA